MSSVVYTHMRIEQQIFNLKVITSYAMASSRFPPDSNLCDINFRCLVIRGHVVRRGVVLVLLI